jgi:hypothetical protein
MNVHLAQINSGRLRAPLDDPKIAGFVAQLDPINALADAAPVLSGAGNLLPATPPSLPITTIP